MDETRPLRKNMSFQSDISSTGMVEISLSSDSLNIPAVIPEEPFVQVSPKRKSLTIKPILNLDPKLIPFILRNLDIPQLFHCQRTCWSWFKEASKVLYRKLWFSQMSGQKLQKLLKTLQKSILSPQGRRQTQLDYSSLVQFITVKNIVFEDDSPLQSWTLVRDIISLCSSTIKGISLSIGDDSFLELPVEYVYLNTLSRLPNLKHLSIHSKCMRVPHKLILELLRAAPIASLQTIKFSRCLYNFDATGWYLICEKGSKELSYLSLTPSVGPNMLGWDPTDGLVPLAQSCPNLKKVDLSGHAFPIPQETIEIFLKSFSKLQEIYFPCNSTDAHLLALMSQSPWPNLKVLGLSCCCVDGEMKESKKNGMCCNKFTDKIVVALLEHYMSVSSETFQIYLPVFVINLQSGKRKKTIDWISNLVDITKSNLDTFWFKKKILLSVPTNRMIEFF